MLVYRITSAKYSRELSASGRGARWNSHGNEVIYTAASRALACLENLVHRSGEGLNHNYKVIVIDIPDDLKLDSISHSDLPDKWYKYEKYNDCRKLGDDWYLRKMNAVLKVPSAIIPEEFNFLINCRHKEFEKIKIKSVEEFMNDSRL